MKSSTARVPRASRQRSRVRSRSPRLRSARRRAASSVETGGDVPLHLDGQMVRQLLVELTIERPTPQQRAEPEREDIEPAFDAHRLSSVTECSISLLPSVSKRGRVRVTNPKLHAPNPKALPTSNSQRCWRLGVGSALELGSLELGIYLAGRAGAAPPPAPSALMAAIASAIIEPTSATLAGSTSVLLFLASSPNWPMYCSATRSCTAS